MTAIADLTDLFFTVSEYAGRGDFAHEFARFVFLTEDRLSKVLRLDGNEKVATIVADAQGRALLPADFREARSVKTSTGYVLIGGSLDVLDQMFSTPSTPMAFAIGGGYINLRPVQGATIELTYWAGMPRLTALAPTNVILLRYPDCYLHGVAYETLVWAAAKGDASAVERASLIRGLLDEAVNDAMIDNERRVYSQSKMRIGGRTP